MNGRGRFAWVGSVATISIAVLIGWFCLIGGREIVESVDVGVLNNRKGPDVLLADRPVIFWGVIGFYTASIVTGAGLAILLASIAVRELTGRRG